MPAPLHEVLDKVHGYLPQADLEPVRRAFSFAEHAHQGQTRRSGEPYIIHPLGVANLIADLKLDVPSIQAGLLHDTVEDCAQVTLDQIAGEFGDDVAFLVDGVTKLGKIPWHTREERQAENFRKMLVAMARDIRVLLVKLADRLDNMRTLAHMPRDKQERIARETLDVYAPLANRLGIQWIKVELEDLSFRWLFPDEYARISESIAKGDAERRRYIEETVGILRGKLIEAGVRADVVGRIKHAWGIYAKMRRTGRELEQIYDVVGFRILTEGVQDCWSALGVIHASWTPVPGRFKDFINLPKPNMYQSLHTTVLGPQRERMEVQIRTQEMHRVAEEGIAAHWRYKEGTPLEPSDDKKFAWLRQIVDWQKEVRDPIEFQENVKTDLFSDEIYVFTPRGDVKAFPKGATPVDFAFAVHSEVGDHCSGARVNGLMVPLRYQLRNGDTVEILTNPNQRPNKDWIKFVATSKAKAKIRHHIRSEQRARGLTLGRELLETELRRYDVSLTRLEKSGELAAAAQRAKLGSVEELLINIGYGKLTSADALAAVLPAEQRPAAPAPAPGPIQKLIRKVTGRAPTGIKVQGLDDILIRYARCCSPVPGDPILGFISHGRGVIVHTRDCPQGMDTDPGRRVEVDWDVHAKAARPVAVQVSCVNKPGMLASISKAFSDMGVNIIQAQCRTGDDDRAINTFEITVASLDQLRTVMRSIQKVPGVYAVQRVAGS